MFSDPGTGESPAAVEAQHPGRRSSGTGNPQRLTLWGGRVAH